MPSNESLICLCGETTTKRYAPGHDVRHASELSLAVHEGDLTESDAVQLIPTADTVARFEAILASRRAGHYRGGIRTSGSWLDRVIARATD